MRIRLLIATPDANYADHLSKSISEQYADTVDVHVCLLPERLQELLSTQKFDTALLEAQIIEDMDLSSIHLPMLLMAEEDNEPNVPGTLKRIGKYQRISSMVDEVLEHYAKVSTNGREPCLEKVRITAVWSPAGGVGKTTVALSYAARKASDGKQVLYLSLEPFSSVPAYFSGSGKSISAVFEMLENEEGNVEMLIRAIKRQDSTTGVSYFCSPDNYDDMHILSTENINALVNACAVVADELVIDMSSVCDERTRQVFKLADRVFLVTNMTAAAQTKLLQFACQNNVFQRIRDKTILVANMGATVGKPLVDTVIQLPYVQSVDTPGVFKTLSGCDFEPGGS